MIGQNQDQSFSADATVHNGGRRSVPNFQALLFPFNC